MLSEKLCYRPVWTSANSIAKMSFTWKPKPFIVVAEIVLDLMECGPKDKGMPHLDSPLRISVGFRPIYKVKVLPNSDIPLVHEPIPIGDKPGSTGSIHSEMPQY